MNAPEAPNEILTPEDFEREFKISRGTQAAMRSRGQLPFLRLGGGRIIRYRRADLQAWLTGRAIAEAPPVKARRRRARSGEARR